MKHCILNVCGFAAHIQNAAFPEFSYSFVSVGKGHAVEFAKISVD
jgi:hypothetical protein